MQIIDNNLKYCNKIKMTLAIGNQNYACDIVRVIYNRCRCMILKILVQNVNRKQENLF